MKSTMKLLLVLEIFLTYRREMALEEVAQITRLNKTTVYNMLSTLIEFGHVERNKRGRYSLSSRYDQSYYTLKKRMEIREIARPYLIALSKKIHETVQLAFGDDANNVFLEKFYDASLPHQVLKVIMPEVDQLPFRSILHTSSIGKILLANMPEEEVNKYFNRKLVRNTPNTITDLGSMKIILVSIRKQGVAFDDEEFALGVRGIAAVIKNADGKFLGSIAVMAPSIRLTREIAQELVPVLRDCAAEVSKAFAKI